jgi:hypothetical protein
MYDGSILVRVYDDEEEKEEIGLGLRPRFIL